MPLPIDYHNHPQAHSIKPYTPELLQPWADSARKKGLKQVAFTDHDRYKDGVNFDEIDKLRSANPDLKFLGGEKLGPARFRPRLRALPAARSRDVRPGHAQRGIRPARHRR
jgi:hypothetical protein